jgi:hypothetical protein
MIDYTPANRLALAMCVAALPGSKPCQAPCNACRVNSAAVARELAEQVVPVEPSPSADSDCHLMQWSKALDQYAQRQQTRAEILALAAELEGTVQTVQERFP